MFYSWTVLICFGIALKFVQSAEKVAVTCASAVSLKNKESNYYLHSHGIAWGSGSGQQSVTCEDAAGGASNLWLVKNGYNSPHCEAGEPIKCGERVRLEHIQTGKLLHSHLFKAPLSGNQEVSAFGAEGKGDTGDDWVLECEGQNSYWSRGELVTLRHADTGKMLTASKSAAFNQQNCGGGCPIMGQLEVSATYYADATKTKWSTAQGVYFPPKGQAFVKKNEDDEEDDEL